MTPGRMLRSCSTECGGCKLEQAAVADLADERLRFADPDAGSDLLHPVPAGQRLPDELPGFGRLQETARKRLREMRRNFARDVSNEEARGTPFFFVPVFLGLGAVIYFTAASEPSVPVLAIAAALMFALWRYRLTAGHRAWVSAALCLTILGAALAKFETVSAASTMLGGEISTIGEVRIRKLEFSEKSVRITADLLSTSKPELKHAPARIKVTLRNPPAGLKAGDIISARFGLQPPSGPVRPGGYDFAFHAWFAGIGANGYAMGKIERIEDRPAGPLDRMAFALENIRMGIARKVKAVVPGTDGAMAAALIAGVAGGIDEDTSEAMRLTGLAHIISISGLHMALVAGVFMVAIRLGFALFPAFSSRLPVKKFGAAAALAASFFYLLLSGAGVATVRSFIMLAVMLVAVLFDRQALTLRNLAISAILILAVTPHEIMGPSFQMSFAATAALISAYSWMAERQYQQQTSHEPHSRLERVKQFLAAATLTPIVAGLATALFSAWHFQRLSPLGLPANLAAMPVVSLIVMPFGVLSALAMPLGLEYWPLRIMGEGVHLMLEIARYFAGLSPAGLTGAIALPAFLASAAALTLVSLLQTRLRVIGLATAPVLFWLLANPAKPDLLVSEDAALVALVSREGILAVNRERPNAFTMQSWQRAARATTVLKPAKADDNDSINMLVKAAKASQDAFICRNGACATQTSGGLNIVWLEHARAAKNGTGASGGVGVEPAVSSPVGLGTPVASQGVLGKPRQDNTPDFPPQFLRDLRDACLAADLVIASVPTPGRKCPAGKATLLRALDLARKGAAEISFPTAQNVPMLSPGISQEGNKAQAWKNIYGGSEAKSQTGQTAGAQRSDETPGLAVRFAVGEPVRPWNRERIFSRAARNMPQFMPVKRTTQPLPSDKKIAESPSDAEQNQHR